MKIIEGLKLKKRLVRKAKDIQDKIKANCVRMSNETPQYGEEQSSKVSGWVQSHGDIVKEISKLAIAIQKTNLGTPVEIQLGGKPVTKSIAEWVLRRRELASLELGAWDSLSDRHLRDKTISTTSGKEEKVTVVRHFDVNERDLKVDTLTHEPSIIDSKLEVVNATTDLEGYTLPESLAE